MNSVIMKGIDSPYIQPEDERNQKEQRQQLEAMAMAKIISMASLMNDNTASLCVAEVSQESEY